MPQKIKIFLNRWYLLVLIALGLTPLVWFFNKPGILINGVDTNFPLNPEVWIGRRFFVWTNTVNAGGDFSSSTSGLFFHLIQYLPFKAGLSLQNTEIFSLVFWFLMIVSGSYYLARIIFPKKTQIQLLFTVLYSYNTYLFNTWENVKVSNLSLVVALPFAIGILARLRKGELNRLKAALYSVFVGVLLSGSGINPSYFLCLILALFLFFVSEIVIDRNIKSFFTSLKNLSVIILVMTTVNLSWILPLGNFILGNVSATGSIDNLGLTNWLDSLSENTSLLNVLRLQGAWDWYAVDSVSHLPVYIPYALNYFYNPIFILFSFLLPGLAFASYIIISRKNLNWYIAFGLMMIIGVFLGAGTHLPTGSMYRFLVGHIAFFSVFRSPWYIFTPLVTIAYAGLIGLLFFSLDEIIESRRLKFGSWILSGIVFTIIIGNLFYTYPLVTGKIFRPGRTDGFFIHFPDYVFQAGKWLANKDEGRIINYPDDEIENFNWGYRGIESILGLLSDRELLFVPLNSPNAPIANLIKEYYRNLKLGQLESANNLASKLNIKYIFNKTDQRSLAPELSTVIKTEADKIFGNWEFYKLSESNFLPKISATSKIYLSNTSKDAGALIAAIPKNVASADKQDKVISKIPYIIDTSGEAIMSHSSQKSEFMNFQDSPSLLSQRLTTRDFSRAIYDFEVTRDGYYEPILERYRIEDFGLDPNKTIEAEVDGKTMNLDVTSKSDSYIRFKPVKFEIGRHMIVFKLANKNLISGGSFNDGYIFKKGGYGVGNTKYSIESNGNTKYLSIANYNKADASVVFNINDFDPFGVYYVDFSYKQVYGNNGTVITYQSKGDILLKASTERLPNYPEWNNFGFYFQPILSPSKAEIAFSAPFIADPLGTKIFYSDIKAYKVFTNNMLLTIDNSKNDSSDPQITFKQESPVKYSGSVDNNTKKHIIVFAENYSPKWQLSLFKKDGTKLNTVPQHFSINAYANGWYIDTEEPDYTFKIYYEPQTIFLTGAVLSFVSVILVIAYYLYNRLRNKDA